MSASDETSAEMRYQVRTDGIWELCASEDDLQRDLRIRGRPSARPLKPRRRTEGCSTSCSSAAATTPYFQGAAAELLESVAELDAAHSRGEGSVRSPWQAQAVPALAGRAGAIHLASTSHPSTVADHSPPSAAVETAAGSNAAARKVGKRPVLVPLGSGGIARWGRSNPISFLRIPKVIKSTLSLESIEHVPWRKLGHVGRDWRFINNYTNGSLVSATSQDHRSGQPGYQSRI
jgi:hypothetical protein